MTKKTQGVMCGLAWMFLFALGAQAEPIKVLIISGANNHNWKQTTPVIEKILEADGLCDVDVTEQPQTLTAAKLRPYRVIVSNYNTFRLKGEQGKALWSEEARQAYVDFVKNGGGHVVVHAGSSSFYKWPDYQKICLGTWSGGTGHGKHHAFVMRSDTEHPITRGITPFLIYEELWHKIAMREDATVLMSSYAAKSFGGTDRWEPSLMVGQFGKGRCVYNVLGHDAAKMQHPAFTALLRRCVEWAATGQVTLKAPGNLPATPEQLKAAKLMPDNAGVSQPPQRTDKSTTPEPVRRNGLVFSQGNQAIKMMRDGQVIWQFNIHPKSGKPYFHPLALPGSAHLTALHPSDHIWHYGLWFNWKYINGLNYWEENKQHISQGRTDAQIDAVKAQPDGAIQLKLNLAYHPPDKPAVLKEKRLIEITPIRPDGSYVMDWTCTFTAGEKDVELSRTPIPGKPGGKNWGGYAGMSLRLAKAIDKPGVLTTKGPAQFEGPSNVQGRASAMEFSGVIMGQEFGVALLDHPDNLNHPSPVYAIRGKSMNFISPAVVALKPHTLGAGKTLTLRYRVMVHPGRWPIDRLNKAAEEYAQQ